MKTREIAVGHLRLGGDNELFLIAGPCVIEDEKRTVEMAGKVKEAAKEAGVPLIFKSSFDKANRSSISTYRGPGLERGVEILKAVKQEHGLHITTDIHEPEHADKVAEVADVIQIPAMLCRQTDLLLAAGQTGKAVNIKKGQFLAPGDMRNAIEKIYSTDNDDILLTERGTSFGYHYLVNDMRSLPSMRRLGYPVVFDATHSVQVPGGLYNRSGGERMFVAPLARAAVGAGVDGIFVEVHPDPDNAPSDGPNMLKIQDLPPLLLLLKRIHIEVKSYLDAEDFDVRPPRPGAGNTLVGPSVKDMD